MDPALKARPGSLAAVLGTLVALTAPLSAQTVVGTVVEEGSLEPLVGAFVQLEDSAGVRHGGVLSDRDGSFVLRAGRPGRYRIVAELIGYAGARTGFLAVREGDALRQTLEVPVRAVSLGGITAEVGERCRRRPGSGPATARLWEEARKALEVTRWAKGQDILRFQIVEHERTLDAGTLEVVDQRESGRSGYWGHSPYRSIPAERLEREGYVHEAADGTWDYFAPDADVLLSGSFLDAHCFRVVGPGPDETGWIGLGFEPVPERTLPDIEGVLWMDEGTAELQRLDYRYTWIPFRAIGTESVGGRVEFERLATGMWIVRRWHVRMPLEAVQRRDGGRLTMELVRLVQQGAEVRSVRTRDGVLLSEATGATLYGTVRDADGALRAGVTVEVGAADRRARTGEDGAFRISGLPAGRWSVRVRDGATELAGVTEPARTVELRAGRATRLPVELTAPSRLARAACAGDGTGGGAGDPVLLFGRVLEPSGGAAASGTVVRVDLGNGERRVVPDSAGVYRLCLEPTAGPVRVAAVPRGVEGPMGELDPTEVRLDRPGLVRVDPRVPDRPDTGAGVDEAEAPVWGIAGRVLDREDDRPVDGALVELRDTAGSVLATQVTDAAGRFRFPRPAGGPRFGLGVRHLGYAPSDGSVALGPGDRLTLDVLVAARPLELEPIVVREHRRRRLLEVGFYARKEAGRGAFIERDEIERRRPSRITDLLAGRAGLRVVDLGVQGSDVRLTHQVSFERDPDDCQPAVWIDGVLAREGGPVRTTGGVVRRPLSGLVAPMRVEAVEVYTGPAGLPIEYRGNNAACGVLLVWTRRPEPER